MTKPLRIAAWCVGSLLLLCALVAGGCVLWLRASLPDLDGNHRITALEAPVEVLRDRDGLVTIRAGNERDAARALGYVHAQDRLWQMDMMRRTGAGRLSEVVGPEALGSDRLMRGLGLYRVAQANLDGLSAKARALAEAYAEGVNAYIAEPNGPWPLEFHLLRYAPEPWRPADSMVWGRLMALQLSNNWWDEILRLRLAQDLSAAQLAFLWPDYPADAPVTLSSLAAPTRWTGYDPVIPWTWAPKDASNIWILSGGRTASGKPILANDLHLALDAPGFWYLARIELPELTLVGATTPGVPYLLAGHNGHIAWGFTSTHGDTQDLFIERLSRDRPGHYDTPDGPRPFATRRETIAIRGQEPEVLEVRETRHGPVLSDLRPAYAKYLADNQVLALAWPALRADDRTGEALYRLNRARNWSDFLAAMADFHSPLQNVGYADNKGTIGFLTAGRVPIRRSGDGRSPVPGWGGVGDWRGFVPFDALPQAKDPPSGRLINANNRVTGDAYRHLIAADWPDAFRAQRIVALLDHEKRATLEGSMALQQDTVSLAAQQLLRLLLVDGQRHELAPAAKQLLAEWDFRMDRARPEPLIFYAWMAALNERIFADELGEAFPAFQRANAELLMAVLTEQPEWCDDKTTARTEDCEFQIHAALAQALDELIERFGPGMADWRWGAAHVARFSHPILRGVPVLGDWFAFAVETDGGFYTVNRGGARFGGTAQARFADIHGPGIRAVYDLADLDNSRFMIATGQSGNPLSPRYGDLAERWRDGDYLKLVGDKTAARYRLTLNPR